MTDAIAAHFAALKKDRSKNFNAHAIELVKWAVPNHDFNARALNAFRSVLLHDGTPGGTTRSNVLMNVREALR